MTVEVGHDGIRDVASAMRASSVSLDRACASPPSSSVGDAAPLLTSVIAAYCGTTSHLAYEAHLIGERIDECARAYSETDSSVHVRLYSISEGSAL